MSMDESGTSTLNELTGDVDDDNLALPGFCQSLECVLRQGLKVGGLGFIGLLDRDYWNCFEGLTSSSRVLLRPPPSINHAITVVKQCKKARTSQGRGRLFIRVALTKGILAQALETLLDNQDFVKYWYKDLSPLVDYRRKGVVVDILKSLRKKKYKLDVNNNSFLDETWLLPKVEKFEFVPCATLGLTLVPVNGKSIIVEIKPGSAAEENKIQIGDCLDEFFEQHIDEKWCVRVGQLKRKHQGKPMTATIIKARYDDGRWFPPLYNRYQMLCDEGRCSMEVSSCLQKESNESKSDSDKVTSQHVFLLEYLGKADIGDNGSCIFVQEGIDKVLNSHSVEKKNVKLQLLERDILITCKEKGETMGRFSYTEISSCGIKDNNPNFFAFVAGNTTCSFADSFDCHVFTALDAFVAKTIIDGIGKGFDRTIYCV